MSNELKSYIISEAVVEDKPKIIDDSNGVVKFTAELQEAERPNRNGRIYGKQVINDALNHYSVKEKIQNKTFYGESGHPLSDDVKRQMYIDQRNISHIITGYRWEGNKLIGVVETALTSAGKDMSGLIRQGSKVAFSMRGLSKSVVKDGRYQRIDGPLSIQCYDWVIVPSHQDSYMRETIQESTNNSVVNESLNMNGKISEIDTKEILDFVVNGNDNIKQLSESMGFDYTNTNNLELEENNQILSIKQNNDQLKIFLTEDIRQSLDEFYLEF